MQHILLASQDWDTQNSSAKGFTTAEAVDLKRGQGHLA